MGNRIAAGVYAVTLAGILAALAVALVGSRADADVDVDGAILRSTYGAAVYEHEAGEMPDTIWSWWIHPLAVQDGDATLIGGVGTGSIKVWRSEPDRLLEARWPSVARDDDHNAPAIAVHATKPSLVFYTGHNDAGPWIFWRTLSDDMQVGEQRTLEFPDVETTYAQVLTDDGDTVVVLTRSHVCRWWQRTSTDWGETWAAPVLVVEGVCGKGQSYVTTAPAGEGRYRLAAYGHPSRGAWRHIDVGLIRLSDGRITRAGNEVVGNLYSGDGLPIRPGDLATVYQPAEGETARLLDLGASEAGDPMLTVATWGGDDVAGTGQYRTVRYDRDRSRWVVSNSLPATGAGFFGDEERLRGYVGGATITDDGDVVLSREQDGAWLAERYRLGWGWQLVEAETFDQPVVRPYAVRGGDTIVMHRLERYLRADDWLSSALMWSGEPELEP